MPKGANQKFKLYRLAQIMLERTDDEHYITMPEIISAAGEIRDHRRPQEHLPGPPGSGGAGNRSGGRTGGQRLSLSCDGRPFELPELKLLVDAIQSSKFITEKKTNALIRKLEKLVSRYEAMGLQRQVYVSGRIKTMNESIYYTVDAIHNAISENKKIRFQYYQWNSKERDGRCGVTARIITSAPGDLSWDDENYYLVGYDSDAGQIRHYRVDKMIHIQMTEEPREGKEHFRKLDMADYARKSFGMFGGREQDVKLLVDNSLAGVIIDRFGKDVMMIPADGDHFTVNVTVWSAVSSWDGSFRWEKK